MYDIFSYVMLDSSNAGQGSLFNLNLSCHVLITIWTRYNLFPKGPYL